jgi:CheY-like chemotaxis protein
MQKPLPLPLLRILLAHDQQDKRTLTAYQLKRSGHKVVTASDRSQALLAFHASPFDVILLDQEMPGMTGYGVARTVRKAEDGKKTRAFRVASTGNTTSEDARCLKLAGFDNVLGKPFRFDDLNLILSSSPAPEPASWAPTTPSPAPRATLAKLVARVGGDEMLLKHMLPAFPRDTPKRIAGLVAAICSGDAQALASLAHALRGSVSIFGAETARKYSQELQELGKSSELSMDGGILASLKEEIAKLQANLRGYANQTPVRPKSNHAWRHRPPRNRGKRRQ